jgi:hypothetical protein
MLMDQAAEITVQGIGRRRSQSRAVRKQKKPAALTSWACILATLFAYAGWRVREEMYLLPDKGVGYALGILGLAFMTLLLLYSLRKRLRFMRSWGALSTWFQVHMLLGIAGPLAILFHSNFQFGSKNSNVALACMLAVSASGVAGRLIYTRIHHGLSGRRVTLQEVKQDVLTHRQTLLGTSRSGDPFLNPLLILEAKVMAPPHGLFQEIANWLRMEVDTRLAYRSVKRELTRSATSARAHQSSLRNTSRSVRAYLRTLRRISIFSVYERTFALWHVIHLPLCFLLFASALVHVIAVHMY